MRLIVYTPRQNRCSLSSVYALPMKTPLCSTSLSCMNVVVLVFSGSDEKPEASCNYALSQNTEDSFTFVLSVWPSKRTSPCFNPQRTIDSSLGYGWKKLALKIITELIEPLLYLVETSICHALLNPSTIILLSNEHIKVRNLTKAVEIGVKTEPPSPDYKYL